MSTRDHGRELKAERDTFAAFAFCWADMVIKLDRNFDIQYARGATAYFTGLTPEALCGRAITAIVAETDAPHVLDFFEASRRDGRVVREPVHIVDAAGKRRPVRLAGYTDEADGVGYLALHKISGRETGASGASHRDWFTGLLDPDSFADLAVDHLQQTKVDGQPVEITLVELPDLARVTTSLSRAARADLIRRIADTIREHAVDGATATQVADGRFGFVHAKGGDLTRMTRAIADITRRADPAGRGSAVHHASIASSAEARYDDADLARGVMYMMNHFGHEDGGRVTLAALSSNIDDLVQRAVNEVSDFKRLVAETRFYIAFQPIVDVRNGKVHHYEALCRFYQDSGDHAPARRIAFAEETGMIHELDLAMVRQAIAWLDQRPANDSTTRVAVNVSGKSVVRDDYAESLCELLDANSWTQGRLLFEITESAGMTDLRRANRFIRALRERGYPVCLDDLGAGAASFRYLSALEVDMVKIDGSAIANARRARKGRAFLSSLADLCHRLGTATVAEMVDDESGLRFVQACGVDFVQGHLFGQPSANLRDFSPLRNATLFQRHRETP